MKNKSRTLINTISSIILQFVTIISGFIIPRLLLQVFNSETNGLVSSLNQFLNCINLLEGGLSSVIMASLYKPLSENNNKRLSAIINTTEKFYKKLAIGFIIYAVIISIVYPLVVKNTFSFAYICSLTLILAINMFVQYCFSINWRVLLTADKKVYIVSITQIIIITLNTLFTVIGIKLYPNIHIIKLITALIYFIQPIVYKICVKKYYNLDKNEKEDKAILKQRWDGFGINVAAFIHNNTDNIILTLFSNLKNVSIYSVYLLVVNGLKSIVTAISSGIVPTIGHIYAGENKEKLNNTFDAYELIIYEATFLLFTVGGILITPFVLLYTKGITDANYNQLIFGIILVIAEAIFCLREPYINMAYSANKFREISKYAYIETGLNIIISIILVKKFGLIGVAIGTTIAMAYRTICHVIYLKKNILYRPIRKTIKKLCVFLIVMIIIITISIVFFKIEELSIINWIIYAFKNSILALICYLLTGYIFFKKEFNKIIDIFKRK